MKVSEIFYSLQGEGFFAGIPSVFIRLAGCPLRCRWCDTSYAWDAAGAKDYSAEEIIGTISQWQSRFVVVTGGEPMINPELSGLLERLKQAKKHITIETAGIAYLPDLPCDLMSISPKLSNTTPSEPAIAEAHEKRRINIAALGELIRHYPYQLKFVVDSENDLGEIKALLDDLSGVDRKKVMLMPEGRNREEIMARTPMAARLCRETGFAFSPRLHILLWDGQKGV